MAKQLLLDFAVVVLFPGLLLGGYFYWKSGGTEIEFDGGGVVATPGGTPQDLGAKTKKVLASLEEISLDPKFFTDPVYLSLKDYPVDIATSSLGRPNPFIPSDELKMLLYPESVKLAPVVPTPQASGAIAPATQRATGGTPIRR
jgi:hypothetical protein